MKKSTKITITILLFFIVQIFVTVASLNAEAKKQYDFSCSNKVYGLAIDKSRNYVEFENIKFRTLRPHTKQAIIDGVAGVNKEFEIDYIVTWMGWVYMFENPEYYNKFCWIFDNMIKHKDNPIAIAQLVSYGESLVNDIHRGKAGRHNIIGWYENSSFNAESRMTYN